MNDVIFREGQTVNLRPIERADAPILRRWMNDPDITQYLMRVFPLMEKGEEEWIDGLSGSTNNFALAIIAKEKKKLIGTIGLHQVNWRHRTAVTGTVIGEKEYLGKGYGTDAKMLLLDFAFNALDLYAVLSHVMAHNGRSLAYGNKCGYEEVARIPNWLRTNDGDRCDEVILIVTQEKWRPLWKEYVEKRKISV